MIITKPLLDMCCQTLPEGRYSPLTALHTVDGPYKRYPGNNPSSGGPNSVEMHPNLTDVYRSRIDALHEALNHKGSRSKAATILRTLIDKIVLYPK